MATQETRPDYIRITRSLSEVVRTGDVYPVTGWQTASAPIHPVIEHPEQGEVWLTDSLWECMVPEG